MGGRHSILAQYPDSLCIHIIYGGFRLYGACGIHNGQTHAQDGASRKVVHPARDGIRMQRPCHNVHENNRKQVKPLDNHTHKSFYELFCTHPYIRPSCRSVLSGTRIADIPRTLPARNNRGRGHGVDAAPLLVQKRRDAFRHGAASLPHTYRKSHDAQHVGKGKTIPAKNGGD